MYIIEDDGREGIWNGKGKRGYERSRLRINMYDF